MFDVHVASSRIIKSQGTCTVAGTRQFWHAKVIAYTICNISLLRLTNNKIKHWNHFKIIFHGD